MVDAARMCLARHGTLPPDDAVTFKDVLDRWSEMDFKKIYTHTGGVCKPSVVLTYISKPMEIWIQISKAAVENDLGKAKILSSFTNLKLTASFMFYALSI